MLLRTIAFITCFFISSAHSVSWAGPIIGGEEVSAMDPVAETTVKIKIRIGLSTGACSGSIIADDLVLTAAHCVMGDMTVLFPRARGEYLEARVTAARVHTSYRETTETRYRHDVALLRFEGGLPAGFKPVRLIDPSYLLKAGQEVLLAGYGTTDAENRSSGGGVLRKATVYIRDPHYSHTEIQLDQSMGRGACFGDSGGPAFIVRNGKPQLFGVTNWGPNACDDYGVFANINSYRRWLTAAAVYVRRQPLPEQNGFEISVSY